MAGGWSTSECWWIGVAAASLALACAVEDGRAPPLPEAADDSPRAQDGGAEGVRRLECTPGAMRACHRMLAEHNGVVSCFEGVQTCGADRAWGLCTDGDVTARVAPTNDEPGVELLALGGAERCTNNPCDPDCRFFGTTGDDELETTLIRGDFPWASGSFAALPAELVEPGVKEPCATGSDCQFNTHCNAPTSGECAHDKCDVGAALTESCDPCVTEICATSPECCQSRESASCQHGLCTVGGALKPACDPCVAQICESFPACCDPRAGAWDETCIAEVAHTCGRECSCCEGETLRNGSCYFLDASYRSWPDARTSCQLRGPGWDLVSIADADENAFVTGLTLNEVNWIGITDGNGVGSERSWQWAGGSGTTWHQDARTGMYDNFYEKPEPCVASTDPHGCSVATQPQAGDDCARLSKSTGHWYGRQCEMKHNVLCEGPQLCGDAHIEGWSCEWGSPAACEHDPCTTGVSLKVECDACVSAVCAVEPSCCAADGAWIERCVGLVSSECSATCSCSDSEVPYADRCYYAGAHSRATWSGARASCQARGAGWELSSIADPQENDFVRRLLGSDGAWLGITAANGVGTTDDWRWSNGDPVGAWSEHNGGLYDAFAAQEPGAGEACAQVHPDGAWYGEACTALGDYVCEGPPGTLSEPTPPSGAGGWSCGELTAAPHGAAPLGWTEQCVEQVATTCGASCSTSDGGAASGTCVPWYPGQTDETCLGVDLSVGIPCEQSIPVCNHGTLEAPAGVRIVHLPLGSGDFGSCDPNTTQPGAVECVTDAPIPPGRCIDVVDCPALSEVRELVVNPPGVGHVEECSCKDNWSAFLPGVTCGPPTCSGGTNTATLERRPIDIIVSIDNSTSMQAEIQAVQRRINDDLAQILEDSGVDYRVILVARYGNVHVFRDDGGNDYTSAYAICIGQPLSSLDCPVDASDPTPPLVNSPPHFFHHSTDIGSRDMLCKLLDSYGTSDPLPAGRAGWTAVAPNGWGEFLRPEALKVFVGITDDATGLNSGATLGNCASSTGFSDDRSGAEAFDRALRQLAPEQFGQYAAGDPSAGRNYIWYSVVGMAGNDPSHPTPLDVSSPIETLCCQGDGGAVRCPESSSSTPLSDGVRAGVAYQELSRMTGGLRYPICYSSNYDQLFNAIAAEVVESSRVSCDFELRNIGSFDIRSARVALHGEPGEMPIEFTQVAGVEDCGTYNWYLPGGDPDNGLTLCPAACSTVQGTAHGRLSLEIGCEGAYTFDPYDFAQTYQGECSFDETVQWGFFSVDALTPDDSSIVVSGRAARTEEGLADEPFIELVTLSSENGNSMCSSPDVSGCPVNLFELLGGIPAARYAFLELSATFNPSADGSALPSVQSWSLTYSCPDTQ